MCFFSLQYYCREMRPDSLPYLPHIRHMQLSLRLFFLSALFSLSTRLPAQTADAVKPHSAHRANPHASDIADNRGAHALPQGPHPGGDHSRDDAPGRKVNTVPTPGWLSTSIPIPIAAAKSRTR